ncbi:MULTISPECIES: hypothetical protein [Streptomyces]|uniref:Uncharacterized protein n=1 Tax=Streptomyces lateritius TaxID=67313 RepID=A0ABW6YAH9_9ACTN|nr:MULTISPECIES: hypothetical protein [Streptomyces]QGZ50580.1 hypothetical protein GPZ77_21390 [Streptomyces sp. QHH-9511]GGT89801.1 hypothetical protein GCM10010272_38330 [Streptomyces lateritius]
MSEPNPYKDGAEYQWGPDQQAGAPGYGYPQPGAGPAYQPTLGDGVPVPPQYPPVPQGGGAPLLSLGDITVVGDQIITPAGSMPLKGAVWNAMDMSRTEEKIPTVAIVLAIVFALLCLIGLLFLLMKEKQTTGFIQVTVTSGGRHHTTMIPATGPDTIHRVMGQLNYARSLSM